MGLRRRDALILGGVGVAAALAGAVVAPRFFRSDAPLAVLKDMPIRDVDGRAHNVAEWTGKALVCNFWATWCPPCREEIPLLESSHRKVLAKGGEILGIALDTASNVVEFTKTVRMNYPVLVTDPSAIGVMARLGNSAGGLPYTVFIDQAGRLVGRKLGMLHGPELDANLEKLLGP